MKFPQLRRRIFAFFKARQLDRELAEELRFHQQMAQEDGADPDSARRALGNPLRIREHSQSVWRIDWLDALVQDVRSALRRLSGEPAFALTVVGLLALTIGANTAVFSFVDRVLLRELPVRDPGQLVQFISSRPGGIAPPFFSFETYQAFHERTDAFLGVFASALRPVRYYQGDAITQLDIRFISGNYLAGLGVRPALGRLLDLSDDQPGAAGVVVLSHRTWRERFGSDRGILGREIRLNNHQVTIVGVTERSFGGPNLAHPDAMWVALARAPELLESPTMLDPAQGDPLEVFARMRPGVDPKSVEPALTLDYRRLKVAVLEDRSRRTPNFPASALEEARRSEVKLKSAARGHSPVREVFTRPLWLLFGAVSLILLIGCANLAALFLARGVARTREAAVRMAIGAGRGRVVCQLMFESLGLGLLGALAGLGVASACERWLLTMLPFDTEPVLDARIFFFALMLAVATTLLFGLYPAFETTRLRLAPALKEGLSYGSSGRDSWVRRSLIAVQVALSVTLLAGATLCLATLRNVYSVELGFEATRITQATVSLSISPYPPDQRNAFWRELVERARQQPGVDGAALSATPLVKPRARIGMPGMAIHLDGAGDAEAVRVDASPVSEGFFSTAGIELLQGREFTSTDRIPHHWPAVVNRAFVKRYLAGRNPLGPHFGFAPDKTRGVEIVGVVADAKMRDLTDEAEPYVWLPHWLAFQPRQMTLLVRGRGDLPAVIRETVRSIDADIPVMRIETPAERLWEHIKEERLFAAATSSLALIALILASVGLTGLISREVAARTREIGIRRALGARPSGLLKLVLAREAAFVLAGVVLGLVLSMTLLRFAESRFYGVEATEPWVLAVVLATLFGAAAIAAWFPARRALSISAASALRHE